MDISNIYVLLVSRQKADHSVICSWDFNNAYYVDSNDAERKLDKKALALEALHTPDPDNPLIIQLPQTLQFILEDEISKHYTATNYHFTIGEILENVRSFTEKVYNEKYSDGEYVFNKLYFEGLTGGGWTFDIKMKPVIENTLGGRGLGNLQQLMNMMMGMM